MQHATISEHFIASSSFRLLILPAIVHPGDGFEKDEKERVRHMET
jgi:hypothetical protein